MNELLVMAIIGGRRCAFKANDVQSVIELGAITPVPRAPSFIAGLTALRSQALTVIDCRRSIGLNADDYPTDSRAAAVSVGGYAYALIVDEIEDIATAQGEPGEITGGFGAEWSRVATGMLETAVGPALMLDLPTIIAGPENLEEAA